MTEALYTLDVLRLAAATGDTPRLEMPDATVERRSPVCGSRIMVDVVVDRDGRIARYGHDVRACALGQASAVVLAQEVTGKTVDALQAARDGLADFLAGRADVMPEWPGIAVLARARPYPARHAAILLPFEAAAEAAAKTATLTW